MNVLELAEKLSLKVLNEGDGATREVKGIYCCDLLSIVMGQAPADSAWVTVMGNLNAIAVAVLTDVSVIVLSERANLDEQGLKKAVEQNVCVLSTELKTFDVALSIHNLI